MSFQVNVAVNDGVFQKKNVTPETTIFELNGEAILIWKDNSIVYDITDGRSAPDMTMKQLNVTPISMLYVYTTDFPCPSGDLRSIVPAQIRLISQFASAASNLFNQAKPTGSSSSSSSTARPLQRDEDGELNIISRDVLNTPQLFKTIVESSFFEFKNNPRKIGMKYPDLAERFFANKDMTFKEYEAMFRSFIEEEVHKNEVIENNPNSDEAKMYLEARRNKELIDEQYLHSMVHHPEDMIPVTMLYINLTINGVPVKAFIDSGAQKSIMSFSCAERCGLNGLIDRRFQAMARGVGGTEKIEGKIHLCDVKVEDAHFLCTFEVMARREMDLLIGLNVLRKHACCINLKTQRLEFGNGTSTPFLQSNEIDTHLEAINALPDEDFRTDGQVDGSVQLTDKEEIL